METVSHLPAVLLLIAPPLWAAWRAGWLRSVAARLGAAVVVLAAVARAWPQAGLEIEALARLTLLVCAATWFWCRRAGRRPPSGRAPLGLAVWVVLAGVVYVNFFAFHGERTFVHLHDTGHYYLGAKYFQELGYDGLYVAALRAEAELYDDRFRTLEARDLTTDRVVHIRELLERSGPVKAAFHPDRWRDFREDVRWLRERLGGNLPRFYLDHGFNATPVWIAIGAPIANAVPAGSARAIAWLAAIDPLLIAIMLGAVGWAFGVETMLLVAVFLLTAYGAGFAWIGGAFLRFGWLATLVVGISALARGRPGSAGVAMMVSAGLRVFPAVFLAVPFVMALRDIVVDRRRGRSGTTRRPSVRFALAAGLTAVTLVALTAAGPRGLGAWGEFGVNTERYVDTVSPNVLGLMPLLAFEAPRQVDEATFESIRSRRSRIRQGLQWFAIPLLLVGIGWRFREGPMVEGAVLGGLALAFVGLALAAYYWVVLLLVLLARPGSHRVAAMLFGLETATYTMTLFEPADAVVFAIRGVLVLYLLFELLIRPRGPAWHPRP